MILYTKLELTKKGIFTDQEQVTSLNTAVICLTFDLKVKVDFILKLLALLQAYEILYMEYCLT